jgi:hypothetical protein
MNYLLWKGKKTGHPIGVLVTVPVGQPDCPPDEWRLSLPAAGPQNKEEKVYPSFVLILDKQQTFNVSLSSATTLLLSL